MILGVALAAGCAATEEDIVLDFNVEDMRPREVVIVCHNDVLTFPLNEGQAEAVLTGIDAAYVRLFYGRDFKWLYLEKGDRAQISFNGKDFEGSFAFEGEKKAVVEYLNTVKLTALADGDFALPFDQYFSKIQEKEADALKLMKARKLDRIGDFGHMEAGRIKYSYGAQLLMYQIGYKFMSGDMSYQPDQSYYDVIGSYMIDDDQWADLDEYRNFCVEAAHTLDAANRNVTDLYPKTVAQMKYIADCFEDGKARQTLLHYVAAAYVANFGIDDIQDLENIYRTYVTDPELLEDYKQKFDKWNLSMPGKPSPALSAEDVDGKVWTLEDFRGKYVYIDMWATWCNPCRKELPYLKALEEKFSDAQIVFVGLSTDGDKAKWEAMVRSGAMTGVQLYLGPRSVFQKAYNVEGIPHFILLDKEGKIISNDMSRPSAEETAMTLSALEGIR